VARLLFIAHDPGGANMLAPVLGLAQAAGHRVATVARGPATALWPAAMALPHGSDAIAFQPDVIVTGTSQHSELERDAWRMARVHGIPSVAAVDSWINLAHRFRRADEDDGITPDAACVLCPAIADRMRACGLPVARIHITGSPHLQAAGSLRRRRPAGPVPTVAILSQPLAADGDSAVLGFDEFAFAAFAVAGLTAAGPVDIRIKPHPREDPAAWTEWIAEAKRRHGPCDIALAVGPAEDVIRRADALVGCFTMMLVEGAIAGIPSLALWPPAEWTDGLDLNDLPALRVAGRDGDGPALWAGLVEAARHPAAGIPLPMMARDASRRLLASIEQEAVAVRRPA
jgi:hypothetical protein